MRESTPEESRGDRMTSERMTSGNGESNNSAARMENNGRGAAPVDVAPNTTPATVGDSGDNIVHESAGDTFYCVNHPNVETLLRCNRCGRPICLKCAELTDVGYRCKECIRGVQDKYFTALPADNLIAFGVAAIVTAIVAPVLGLVLRMFWLFGWILAFMLGGVAGGILVQIIRTAVSKRRGRHMRHYAVGGVVLGVLLGAFAGSMLLGVSPIALLFNIPLLIFTFLAAAAANRLLR